MPKLTDFLVTVSRLIVEVRRSKSHWLLEKELVKILHPRVRRSGWLRTQSGEATRGGAICNLRLYSLGICSCPKGLHLQDNFKGSVIKDFNE